MSKFESVKIRDMGGDILEANVFTGDWDNDVQFTIKMITNELDEDGNAVVTVNHDSARAFIKALADVLDPQSEPERPEFVADEKSSWYR